ncbi:MAG: hydroxymethylglutaryl-CoA lyase, partial [Desulfovibrionales bacterium]|nr:hydroxymethylglutaryl-CoA lyase [Desulfovibrionales bacterium]
RPAAAAGDRRRGQLGDAAQVFEKIQRNAQVTYSALVPNSQGLDGAMAARVDKICLFTAASETFNQKNINTSVRGALERFKPVIERAQTVKLPVRAYISTAFWCAFEGRIKPDAVFSLALSLMDMGINEISISDTIGRACPGEVAQVLGPILGKIPREKIAVHFHDTYGRGVANVLEAVSHGIEIIDASVGGLGGCPFAPGATGNVATEDVVKALEKAGEKTRVDAKALARAGDVLGPYILTKEPTIPHEDSIACSTCEFSRGRGCSVPGRE